MSEPELPVVILYFKPTDPYSLAARDFLSRRRAGLTVYDVSEDVRAWDEMVRLSGQYSVPVVVIEGQVLVGFDREQIARLLPHEKPPLRLGVSIASVQPAANRPGGAYIGQVGGGSLAERAGIRPGDVLIEMAQRPVRSAADVHAIMAEARAGDQVSVTLWRAGRTLRLSLRLRPNG